MNNNFLSVFEIADLLDIDAISAKELLEGTIEFESDELFLLATYKNVSIDKLSALIREFQTHHLVIHGTH